MEKQEAVRRRQPEHERLFCPLILARLGPQEARKGRAAGRWEKVWADPVCGRYKRPDNEEHWLWNEAFYNAPVDDLRHIARLVGVKI